MKHFKLTKETKIILGKTLYRIEATIDSEFAKKGDKGGFVEKEDNLSDNAWIYGNAKVYENAEVYENAKIYGNAWVFHSARVFNDAMVFGNARVYGNS